jgi:hypothetical protein
MSGSFWIKGERELKCLKRKGSTTLVLAPIPKRDFVSQPREFANPRDTLPLFLSSDFGQFTALEG